MPTYRAFREWVLNDGCTAEELASAIEADDPFATAERILVHLANTHWDDEPLPYPKLCRLYDKAHRTPDPDDTPDTPVQTPPLGPDAHALLRDLATHLPVAKIHRYVPTLTHGALTAIINNEPYTQPKPPRALSVEAQRMRTSEPQPSS
jgi:hypothetical protein